MLEVFATGFERIAEDLLLFVNVLGHGNGLRTLARKWEYQPRRGGRCGRDGKLLRAKRLERTHCFRRRSGDNGSPEGKWFSSCLKRENPIWQNRFGVFAQ